MNKLYNIDIHVTMHRVKFLIIKPTKCTSFSSLFLEWNSTHFLCPSSGVFHCTQSKGIHHTGLRTGKYSWWWTEKLSETCRVSFRNKIEKLVHLVGFIIRI